MASASYILILAFVIPMVFCGEYPAQCDFDPVDCVCTNSTTKGEYDSALCTSGNLLFPNFTQYSSPASYSIWESLNIVFTPYVPSKAFAVFKVIKSLALTRPGGLQALQWDVNAFSDSKIQALSITNVDTVIPPPHQFHVHELGDSLEALTFINCDWSSTLTADSFSSFPKLTSLWIEGTYLAINESAFNGLDLEELWLKYANIGTFPTDALKNQTSLFRIDLTGSSVNKFTKDDFTSFPQLIHLILDGNDVQAAIDSGALLNLPKSLNDLLLQNSDPPLKAVPASVIASAPQVKLLSLNGNTIDTIRNGDFPANGIASLDLSNNNITSIESGALQNLSNVYNLALSGTKLHSFDFSLLQGMKALKTLDLSGSAELAWLNVSDISEVPNTLQLINVSYTPLEYIDSKLEEILAQPRFQTFDLSNVTTLVCNESIVWMAKYVLCPPQRIYAPNANCGNNNSTLFDFLSAEAPKACDVVTSTVAAPTQAPITAAPTPAASTVTPNEPTTTPKGASSITANVAIMAAMGAALALFKPI